eukprot:936531_1
MDLSDNITRLINAVKIEDIVEIRKISMLRETDVNTPDEEGRTALNLAAKNGYTEAVRILLENSKVNVNKACNTGCTPLNNAADKGYTEIIRILLENPKINVNKANNNDY